MYLITTTILSILGLAVGENCDKLGVLLYESFGCKPISEGPGCPKNFECQVLARSGNNCNFRGRTYKPGEQLDDDLSYPHCKVGCFCGESGNEFTCAVLDCPEWLGLSLSPGCQRTYAVDKCCSTGQICPVLTKLENGSIVESFENSSKCEVDGHTYKEGERFSPADSCHSCVCQKGWTGKIEEPFCIRQTCADQLYHPEKIYNSCAPIYQKDITLRCCPLDFYCPDGTETVQGNSQSDETCKFGNKEIKLGQYIEKSNIKIFNDAELNKIRCECTLPPLVTCLEI